MKLLITKSMIEGSLLVTKSWIGDGRWVVKRRCSKLTPAAKQIKSTRTRPYTNKEIEAVIKGDFMPYKMPLFKQERYETKDEYRTRIRFCKWFAELELFSNGEIVIGKRGNNIIAIMARPIDDI